MNNTVSDAIFNIHIDAKARLWTLDQGQNGLGQPRLLCFDNNTKKLVTQIDIPINACGIGSYIQDMNIDTACRKIYIADSSAFANKPAIVIVDIATKHCRRVLESDSRVLAGDYKVVNKCRTMKPAGPLFHFHPGLDPIAPDRKNEWLYCGTMSGDRLHRIRLRDLNNENLPANELGRKARTPGPKTTVRRHYHRRRGQCLRHLYRRRRHCPY